MGTTCTADFVVGGVTFYSILYPPVNIPLTPLSRISLTKLQERLVTVKVIIIDEVSMMENNCITLINVFVKLLENKT